MSLRTTHASLRATSTLASHTNALKRLEAFRDAPPAVPSPAVVDAETRVKESKAEYDEQMKKLMMAGTVMIKTMYQEARSAETGATNQHASTGEHQGESQAEGSNQNGKSLDCHKDTIDRSLILM
jgi:hypothetical protein